MIVTQPRFASFEDYLATDPSELPEGRFEPENECVTVLSLVEIGTYRELGLFSADESIGSQVFPNLNLKVDQILKAGR